MVTAKKEVKEKIIYKGGSCGGSVYGVGFIGALVYFTMHAGSVSEFFIGLGKSIVWPAILVYRALELLGM